MNNTIKNNPIKLEIVGIDNKDVTNNITRTFRGHATKIDINALDGYGFRSLSFQGAAYTREDALRLSDFFKVHAYCLRSENEK